MTEQAIGTELRDRLISDPEMILEDRDLMRALIAANERHYGANVVDLRGIAMERLEARLDRLEDTHRTVIAAAYENLSGMHQVHRACLALLDPVDFESFLTTLSTEVAPILRLSAIRLVLETRQEADATLSRLGDVLCLAQPGFSEIYLRGPRPGAGGAGLGLGRDVVLRRTTAAAETIFGATPAPIRSEAVMRLDLGPGRLPALLVMGSAEAQQFHPSQATDLLAFFAGLFERAMRRWLA